MHNSFLKKTGIFLDEHFGTLAIFPALIGLAFVLVYPVIVSILWSFTNKSIMRQTTDVIWFDNFIFLLKNRELWISMRNGLVYTTCTILLQIVWGSGTALLLDRFLAPSVSKPIRLLYMIPWTFPVIVSVLVWGWLYNDSGLLSTTLYSQNWISAPMSFLASKRTALSAVVFVHAWSGAPLIMMTTLAGLQSIPQEQYDVALIEGANGRQTFHYVILPNIKRILQVIIVLRCVWIFNNFNMIFLLTGGGPGSATQNMPIMAYKYAWNSMQMGISSAVSVIMLVFLVLMFSIYQWVNSKVKGENDAF